MLVFAALAAAGCLNVVSEDQSSVGDVTGDCLVPLPAGVSAFGAPLSLEYPDASLLIWESVTSSAGDSIPNPAALASSSAELCASGPALMSATDADGTPLTLLALSEQEAADNARRTDGKALVLSPRGGFVHDDVGYLYYEQLLVGPGVFEAELLGTGLCVVSTPDEPCTRLDDGDSTLLWPASAWPKNRGGLVHDGRALILGCRQVASFETPCVISGVPLDQIRDPAAYRYYSAFQGWVEEPALASVVFRAAGAATLTSVEGRYGATNLDIFEPVFRLRFASEPTGPFDIPLDLFRGIPPAGPFTQGGSEHRALRAGARDLAFSYFVDRQGADYGLHLVHFELNAGLP